MASGEPADQELVQRFRSGDEGALRILFARYEPRLRERLERQLPPELRRKVSGDDLLQEVHLTAYRRFHEFEALGEGAFGAWLERIAAFKVREEVRRYRETAKRGAVQEITRGARPDTAWFAGRGPSPSEAAIGAELTVRIGRAVEALPEHYAEILRLVQTEHMTLRDAGERMGCSREAAKKLYGRALNRLAALLEDEDLGAPHE